MTESEVDRRSALAVQPDEFFVGWLEAPAGYRRFLRPIVVAVLVLALGVALLVAATQRSPGPAVWDAEVTVTLEGVIDIHPYAMIRVPGEGPGDPPGTVFLVEEGKFGAVERVRTYDGQAVRVIGTMLHRDGRRMLELAPGDTGIQPITKLSPEGIERLRRPVPQSLGMVTLRGEIIDSKCYLGAMKPGAGKTHKACAALCLSGGIPPMLVTRDPAGLEAFHLLTTLMGGPAGAEAIRFVGDPVEVMGELDQVGDLRVLKIGANAIRRR